MNALSPAQHARGQQAALRANLMMMVSNAILIGPVMMLFANDVLGFSPKRIAAILAIIPLVGLARIVLLETLRRQGKRRIIYYGEGVRLAIVLVLLLLPSAWLSFELYVALLCVYVAGQQLGVGVAWQPLLRDITTTEDRGRFFARMRFWFQVVTAAMMIAIPFLIGQSILPWQYKGLLLLAVAGAANRIYWVRRIPELPPARKDGPRTILSPRLWQVLKRSPLLRLPLLIAVLVLLIQVPIYVVYLKTMMHAPSNIASAFIAASMLGVAASLLLWGRIADALGFRPLLTGLLLLFVLLTPLHLLIAPFPQAYSGLTGLGLPEYVTLAVLLLQGFLQGALAAGIGIANTSIQHYHVRSEDSFEAMNLYQMALVPATGLVHLFYGYLLDDFVLPRGNVPFANGVLHFDWLKGYFFCVAVPMAAVVLVLIRRLPNTRPWFGVGHFFTSLSMSPLRVMMAERFVYHEDEDTRCRTARWFAAHPSPLTVDPLSELLSDPSYDVRVAAIRALAETGSDLAGKRLLAMLEDENQRFVAAHVAWALGELRYRPAVEALLVALRDKERASLQAMAARALGKLGDERAVEPLAELLRRRPRRRLVVSSAARALLRFDGPARAYAEPLFGALASLEEREDRFELMDGLCGMLGISNTWLLRYLEEAQSARGALGAYAAYQNAGWRSERADVLEALEQRRTEAILEMVAAAAADDPVIRGLRAVLARCRQLTPVHVMAVAWLMLKE